jgi:hypothetical protein
VTRAGADTPEGCAVLSPPDGDRVAPEAAAVMMALSDRRQSLVRIAGEHCEHGDRPSFRCQRRQAGSRGNNRVIEMRRYGKDRPVRAKES